MNSARKIFRSWPEAWRAWVTAAGAGGSVVLAEAKHLPPPAEPSAVEVIRTLDTARELAFTRHEDGGSVPEILVRGPGWELTWHAGGRSRVTLERHHPAPDGAPQWALTVEIREHDDGTPVVSADGAPAWTMAPEEHWRWQALRSSHTAG